MDNGHRHASLRITGIYLVVGMLWILFSDSLLTGVVSEPTLLTRLQTAKGWFYVAVTAALLFWLIRRYSQDAERTEEELRSRNEELCMVEEELRQQLDEYEKSQVELHETNQALRESEERYRLLFSSNPHPMWVYDMETLAFLEVNDAAVAHYGYTREEFLAMTIRDIRPSTDASALEVSVARARQCPGLDLAGIWCHRKKDGTLLAVEITSHTLDFGGRPAEVVLANDVTERVRADEEIRRLNGELEERVQARTRELEHANRELESFSYSVSHDLRAPLRHIDGFSRMLLEDYGERIDATGKGYIQRIRSAAQRMGRLIDDLLQLANVSRSELEKRQVNLSALAQVIGLGLKQIEGREDVTLRITEGVMAFGDPRLLRVVLENLLSNAWKYTGKRADAVIEFAVEEQGSGRPVYLVRDNGVGFDMTFAGKLFTPFQRLHSADEFEGTGIGLATVRRIVERHGGTVWVEAAPDHGATFYFTLGEEEHPARNSDKEDGTTP
ncbi:MULTISPECIES: sensor histidine kinase [Geobacter]|uniref:sensor histidine kinase n=1 Tax=Geobacter TaxID=28231 RepID=UPI002574199B|nr:ATP-binding protein [Geobacter sulfurreducens]BEH08398.1 ATP-binding protein [Geobacter sulfurreducens subsp. ethanolicus]BET59877.1 ATP-binding protein [Geobacter sp. 60473]HML77284.1 ATP-binding protein [Geobacter sulfurreducens]